ncbi:hypothetical protein GCM10009736_71860 [Actinomadura bangladeshensis]
MFPSDPAKIALFCSLLVLAGGAPSATAIFSSADMALLRVDGTAPTWELGTDEFAGIPALATGHCPGQR